VSTYAGAADFAVRSYQPADRHAVRTIYGNETIFGQQQS
jgi:hypothetical protein